MATASRTWVFNADTEGLTDVGDDAALGSGWIVADGNPPGALEWLQNTGVGSANGERSRTGAISWETMFTIPAGSTITDIQCTGWDSLTWTRTNIAANGIRTRIRFVDSGGVSVHSAGDLADVSELPAIGGTITGHGAGTSRAVNAGSQASSSTVSFEIQLNITDTGTPNLDYEHDNIAVTVTYTPPAGPPPVIPQPPIARPRSFA